jgi:predicted N-acyltransferase
MPDAAATVSIHVARAIAAVDQVQWDACAGAGNPFVSHAFLTALEASGSVSARTGWQPQHLLLQGEDRRLLGCVPLYLKSHSYGEYVFDWSWADAFERAGGRYYPKLQAAVPFTPVPGGRLLVRDDAPAGSRDALALAIARCGERLGVSSAHVTFHGRTDAGSLAAAGFLPRTGVQYHWDNRGYRSFEDFLGTLVSRKRKAIRKERASVAESGIRLSTLTGAAIRERHWDSFYRFYRDTIERKWAHAYLTREFFLQLGERLPERVVLILAETTNGRAVGGALNLLGNDTLYGRYWGCEAEFRFLHFEACYYRAIDFAIERGLARVEAGAQGEHKLQRGYLPVPTLSAHWIADARFRRAIERFLDVERQEVATRMAELTAQSPYRTDQPAG